MQARGSCPANKFVRVGGYPESDLSHVGGAQQSHEMVPRSTLESRGSSSFRYLTWMEHAVLTDYSGQNFFLAAVRIHYTRWFLWTVERTSYPVLALCGTTQ